MSLALVTDVTEEPVSLDEMKAHLRLDIDDDDAYLAGCITAARTWVEGQTRRAILPQTWAMSIDYCWPVRKGYHQIDIPMNPLVSVTSISYVDENGASQTLASSQYTVVARRHHSYIVPAYGVSWPNIRSVPNAVTVTFLAGVADQVPQELHRAMMILAGVYYEMRETAAKAPEAVEILVSPYRKANFA